MQAIVFKAKVFENSSFTLLNRVVGEDGLPVAVADIDSILVVVSNITDPIDTTLTTTLDDLIVSDCIQPALVTDDVRFQQDSIGYNCSITIDGTAIPTAGDYRVEVKMTPVSGNVYYFVWELNVIEIYSA